MNINDFDYALPPELIARYPLAERTASRLMHVDKQSGELSHLQFHHIIDLIQPGDVLVFNNTKVIPARIFGKKVTGGQVEIFVERILDNQRMLAQVRASKPLRVGDDILLANETRLTMVGRTNQFYELRHEGQATLLELVEALGEIPLPPYMHRAPDVSDLERYQTVYAEEKGSVAAPTAGLHFDQALLTQLQDKHIELAYLTLHIGAGTFLPVRVEDIRKHQMHAEYLEVPEDVCEQIRAAKARGNRVIAVGTTTLRALETAAQSGCIAPYVGETSIFIYPGYQFRCVDALITNLHLPKSTLLMLVCAFAGHEQVMHAYHEAVKQGYRFYSYGDAMLLG